MEPMEIIVAVDEHGGFGKDGKIPWYFKEDLKRFKEITSGHICIMGRRTYDDMLQMMIERESKKTPVSEHIQKYLEAVEQREQNPNLHLSGAIKEILPNRECYVLTQNKNHFVIGAAIVSSLREAIHSLSDTDSRKVFVIGGYRAFIEALPWVSKIHMTVVEGDYRCDVRFPMKYINSKFVIDDAKKANKLKQGMI